MPKKSMEIVFPALGVIRRMGLRAAVDHRGPFPAPWATNVRLEDSLTNRLRGGSFAGIAAGDAETIVYRDRSLTFDDNAITATRVGDHTDTTLSPDLSDTMRPALFQLSEAGDVGEDVVALVPHKDSFLLGFTAGETWVQQGDPLTGTRRNVSREVGIIAARAWCKREDTIFFLSSRGLYSVGADGSGLKPVSEDKISEELTGVSDSDCVLNYQHSDRGVYIHKTGTDWFYDTERDGFWPFTTSSTASHVLIGPFRLGTANSYGRILRLYGVTAEGSADVTWALVPGDTAEEAAANGKAAIVASLAGGDYSSYVHSSGSWAAGINNSAYPRTRAQWVVLWLASSGTWAWEGASLTSALSGRWR